MKRLLVLAAVVFCSASAARAREPGRSTERRKANELTQLRHEVNDLRSKLRVLEERLSNLEEEEEGPGVAGGAKEDELESELEAALGEAAPEPKPPAQPASGGGVTAISRAFNPAISVNGLFTGGYLSRPDAWKRLTGIDFDNGLNLQEVEARFTGDVDPFLRADLTFTFDQSGESEVEEAYVKLMQLPQAHMPSGLSVKAGKLLAPFGRHNLWHTHQWPFIDPPLANSALFGPDGLNELGGEASYLFPASWYSELTVAAYSGDNDVLFGGESGRRLGAYHAHLKNFFDLSEATTLEIGQSYAAGRHSSAGSPWTHVAGADLTVKWRPLARSTYRSLVWQSEYLWARRDQERELGLDTGGAYTYLAYQFARTWWLQARYDNLGFPSRDGLHRHRWTALLALVPSEFSALRLQYAYGTGGGERDVQEVLLQLNYTMGSHPAHNY